PCLSLVLLEPPRGKELSDVADAFVTVGARGALSRVLVGELRGPVGKSVLRLAVKLQSDEYPIPPEGGPGALTNDAVEAAWDREVDLLERGGGARAGIPGLVEVLGREAGRPAVLPPTLFCKRRQAFFAASCPECGAPLADVRDDALLEAHGLPRRDRSLARFVACPRCLERRDVRLWTLVREPRHGREVGDQSDLFRAFGRLARAEG